MLCMYYNTQITLYTEKDIYSILYILVWCLYSLCIPSYIYIYTYIWERENLLQFFEVPFAFLNPMRFGLYSLSPSATQPYGNLCCCQGNQGTSDTKTLMLSPRAVPFVHIRYKLAVAKHTNRLTVALIHTLYLQSCLLRWRKSEHHVASAAVQQQKELHQFELWREKK